ncbi:M3 family oligoendopeptidase [Azotosporobacter soli]|uniref:M3 family oligoendopeptidase n=1 Tax=Azotosporobacter soli TaxID=3055040 RepID=UPI0031FE8D33
MDKELCWDLTALYDGFETPDYQADFALLRQAVESLKGWNGGEDAVRAAEEYIAAQNEIRSLAGRLYGYASLTYSADTTNSVALARMETVAKETAELAAVEVRFARWLAKQGELTLLAEQSALLKEHLFFLQESVSYVEHLLSEAEELLYARLRLTASSAWSQLHGQLTATLQVEMKEAEGVVKRPLSEVRNLAFSGDAKIREAAYDAELLAYETIKDSGAACLNGIKGEVITLAKARGYASPLARTVKEARMEEGTLTAMLTALKEALPQFRRFYRAKAALFGYSGGLPFYDLFAPVGVLDKQYSYTAAKATILESFRRFSPGLEAVARNAFEQRWIDVEPRRGKRGGAFCHSVHRIAQSRILCNFSGSFSHLTTIAHELGHAYHAACLFKQPYLNTRYTMPIAETASIFCETVVKDAVLCNASEEERFVMLENDISDAGQVIVDIYSRYLFESELFRRRENGALGADELCSIMLKAQQEAYGDGLDQEKLHPYMWLNKPHYYSAGTNFYNFPYAFGLLFAKGLYAIYRKKGAAFVAEYDNLLAATGKDSLEEVAALAGIDIRTPAFWRESLAEVTDQIETFIGLAAKAGGR